MHIAFPFKLDRLGLAVTAGEMEYVEGLIEQILFTRPGERVNQPEFGCGVQALVFGPVTFELATAIRARIEAAMQRWLSVPLHVEATEVDQQDSTLTIHITYVLTATGERRSRTYRL